MQRTRASFAVGLNRPVSMDEMVWRETPTSPYIVANIWWTTTLMTATVTKTPAPNAVL